MSSPESPTAPRGKRHCRCMPTSTRESKFLHQPPSQFPSAGCASRSARESVIRHRLADYPAPSAALEVASTARFRSVGRAGWFAWMPPHARRARGCFPPTISAEAPAIKLWRRERDLGKLLTGSSQHAHHRGTLTHFRRWSRIEDSRGHRARGPSTVRRPVAPEFARFSRRCSRPCPRCNFCLMTWLALTMKEPRLSSRTGVAWAGAAGDERAGRRCSRARQRPFRATDASTATRFGKEACSRRGRGRGTNSSEPSDPWFAI